MHAFACELGDMIASNSRFEDRSITFADIDVERIRNERLRDTTLVIVRPKIPSRLSPYRLN